MSDDESDEPLEDLRREVEDRTGDDETDDTAVSGDRNREGTSADEIENDEGSAVDEAEIDEESSVDDAADDEGPLGDLRREVESRTEKGGSGEPDTDDTESAGPGHFAEMDVDDVDTDEVWAEMLLEDDAPLEGAVPPTETDEVSDRPGTVVTKRLCHRCQYFGDPPTLHCTHDGTSIEELVDMDHYRVTNCPMVALDYDEDDTV